MPPPRSETTAAIASTPAPDGRDVRWAAHRIARRRELVDAALRAIRRHGAGVGMDEIAAEAGTSKTVIYRHLGDRLGLYLAVCESVDARILTEIDAAAQASGAQLERRSAPGPSVLSAVIDSYLRLVERDPEVYRFVVRRPDVTLPDGPSTPDPVTGLSGRIADTLYGVLLSFAQDGDRGGDDAQARGRARAFSWGVVGLVKESADRWLENPDGLSRGELARHLAQLAHSGLTGVTARTDVTDSTKPAPASTHE